MASIMSYAEYGGLYSKIQFVLDHLPVCEHYCEPFGGSAAILLNRPPSPIETYNDSNSDVVAFFRTLRDYSDEFIRRIELTPYSREEYEKSISRAGNDVGDMERAWAFYVRARMVRGGLVNAPTAGRWLYSRTDSRYGMAGAVSRWLGGQKDLIHVANRLITVQIENTDYRDLIDKYDDDSTLFFCDPPLPPSAVSERRVYGDSMSVQHHKNMAGILHQLEARVAVTGPNVDFMNELYHDWVKFEMPDSGHDAMWANYKIVHLTGAKQ